MFSIVAKERFDEVGETDANGYVDYAYHGFNYRISDGNRSFTVRTYDVEPGVAAVIEPTNVLVLAEAAALMAFVLSTLGSVHVKAYDAARGAYKLVDPHTLQFKPET
jgi:hypothetical protein